MSRSGWWALIAFSVAGCGGTAPAGPDPTAHVLDHSFGVGGVVTSAADVPTAAILQPDGGIVVATLTAGVTVGLVRFGPDGVPDASFGHAGVAAISSRLDSGDLRLAATADGSFYAVRGCIASGVCVEKHRENGSIDTSFGTAGVASFAVDTSRGCCFTVAAVNGTGDIVVAGAVDAGTTVARFTPTGTRDGSFGAAGTVDLGAVWARGLAIQPDGAAVVATLVAGDTHLIRLSRDGVVDTAYAAAARASGVVPWAGVVVRDDGGTFVGGVDSSAAGAYTALAFDLDGHPDSTFGSAGIAKPDLGAVVDPGYGAVGYLYGAAIDRGDLLLAGNRYSPPAAVLAELRPDGTVRLVTTLRPDPATHPFWDIALVQPDDRIVLVGTTGAADEAESLMLARYLPLP